MTWFDVWKPGDKRDGTQLFVIQVAMVNDHQKSGRSARLPAERKRQSERNNAFLFAFIATLNTYPYFATSPQAGKSNKTNSFLFASIRG